MKKLRTRPESETSHDQYSFTEDAHPYLRFREDIESRVLKFTIIDGVPVIVTTHPNGDDTQRVQWWAHFEGKWYSDFIRFTDKPVTFKGLQECCDILLDHAESTLYELKKKKQ